MLVPEYPNQQRHRDQRRFPEKIKQKQVERSKNPDQRGFQKQQQDEEFLHSVMHRLPRNQHTQRREKRCQHNQPQRNAINPHVVMDIGAGNPLPVDLIVESRVFAVEINRQVQGQDKRQQRNNQRKDTNVAVAAGKQHQQQSPRERRKRYQRQNEGPEPVGVHRTPIQIM